MKSLSSPVRNLDSLVDETFLEQTHRGLPGPVAVLGPYSLGHFGRRFVKQRSIQFLLLERLPL